MELLTLSCKKCGAPLNVPLGTNFVTCSYCKSQLAIHVEGGAIYTELLGQIDQKTTQILDKVNTLVDRAADAGPYHWELGEVIWRLSHTSQLFRKYIEFAVVAQGPRGQYTAGVSTPVAAQLQKWTKNIVVPMQNRETEAVLNAFCQNLIGEGWQAYEVGQGHLWYSRKFRRRFK